MMNDEQQIKDVLKNPAFLESLNSDEAKYLQNKLSTKKPIFEVDAPKWLKHAHRVFSACVVCCFFVLTTYVLFRFLPAYDSKRFSVLLMQAGICVGDIYRSVYRSVYRALLVPCVCSSCHRGGYQICLKKVPI